MFPGVRVVAVQLIVFASAGTQSASAAFSRTTTDQLPERCVCASCLPPPCVPPKGIDFYPEKPITAEMLRKANYEAFVKEVVHDEDKKIMERAVEMARRLEAKQASDSKRKEAFEQVEQRARLRATAARRQAAEEISKKAAEFIRQVARDAHIAGRREQLLEDQRAFQQAAIAEVSSAKEQAKDAEARAAADAEVAARAEAGLKKLEAAERQAAKNEEARAAVNVTVAPKTEVRLIDTAIGGQESNADHKSSETFVAAEVALNHAKAAVHAEKPSHEPTQIVVAAEIMPSQVANPSLLESIPVTVVDKLT